MDIGSIAWQIEHLHGELSRLDNVLTAMTITDLRQYPQNYESLSTDAALRAEKIACRLRNLIYTSTTISKREYLPNAAETHGIHICVQDGIVQIELPRILPKRRQRQSGVFLLDPLQLTLEQYARQNSLPYFRNCVVVFVHTYDAAFPKWVIPDYDNLQQKQVLDLIATFVMVDDCGVLCDTYNTSVMGAAAGTTVYVMAQEQYLQWISDFDAKKRSAARQVDHAESELLPMTTEAHEFPL